MEAYIGGDEFMSKGTHTIEEIYALPEEKQEALDNFIKALETLFGWNGEAK